MIDPSQRGLSARHLILFFLAGVAVCGVFFALGFLVGYNQRPSAAGIETERIVSSGAVPPTVNPLPGEDKSSGAAAPRPSLVPDSLTPDARGSGAAGAGQVNPANGADRVGSAKRKRAGAPAPEVTETNLEDETRTTVAAGGQGGKVAAGIVIQVVASSTRQDAANLVDVLKTRGYGASLVTPEEANVGDKLYRVEVGPFASRDAAEKVRQKLVGDGFKPFIRR